MTVEERMETEAEFGLFYIYTKLTKKKAAELEAKGFDVRDSKEKRTYPRLFRVAWEWAAVEEDVNSANEKAQKYSEPERLWIISSRNSLIKKTE